MHNFERPLPILGITGILIQLCLESVQLTRHIVLYTRTLNMHARNNNNNKTDLFNRSRIATHKRTPKKKRGSYKCTRQQIIRLVLLCV